VKASGFGRFGTIFPMPSHDLALFSPAGPEGLRALTCPKAVTIDRWPSLIQTSIPPPLQYPIRSVVKAWLVNLYLIAGAWISDNNCGSRDFVSGMTALFGGDSLSERLDGAFAIIKASR
jgi:hypothetical protein